MDVYVQTCSLHKSKPITCKKWCLEHYFLLKSHLKIVQKTSWTSKVMWGNDSLVCRFISWHEATSRDKSNFQVVFHIIHYILDSHGQKFGYIYMRKAEHPKLLIWTTKNDISMIPSASSEMYHKLYVYVYIFIYTIHTCQSLYSLIYRTKKNVSHIYILPLPMVRFNAAATKSDQRSRHHKAPMTWPPDSSPNLWPCRGGTKGIGSWKWPPSWWFQPIWKILVKMGIFPNRGENKKYLKPPPRTSSQTSKKQGARERNTRKANGYVMSDFWQNGHFEWYCWCFWNPVFPHQLRYR